MKAASKFMKAWLKQRQRRPHAVVVMKPGIGTDWLQAALLAKPKPKLTSDQLADKVLPWIYALAIAVVLATGGIARADEVAELRKAAEALRAAAPGSDEQKRAGQWVCRLTLGPLGVATWGPDGSLICLRITDVAQK